MLTFFLLLYLNFRRLTETFIVLLSVPLALVGGVWLMWALDYNLSVAVAVAVAVAVGFMALAGVAAETGVVKLIYISTMPGSRPRSAAAASGVRQGLRIFTVPSWKVRSSACDPR